VIAAGIEGFIATSYKRAGDAVKAGEVLAELDDRDLELEQVKWSSTREQRDKEYRGALAGHDAAKARILGAQVAQAEAQLELVRAQLARRKLVAPFDGIVVEGDVSSRIGSPVQRGEVLFEVAPLEGYRVVLEVDEREIARVEKGQHGRLTLPAMPGTSLPLLVHKITPVSTVKDGLNYFRVEADLEESPGFLRPGLEGVAKLATGRRSLFWVWTHEALDWLRLSLWSWWA
jgi:RND family efflux transporter MFP subunit